MKLFRLVSILLSWIFIGMSPVVGAEKQTVAIIAIIEHPALDAARDGIVARLSELGLGTEKVEIVYKSAQGQPSIAAQIARQFVGSRPDVIIAIATPAAQAVASSTKDIPIVFTAVTDPVGAGLVSRMSKPGGNVTGISDLSPISEQFALMLDITPGVERLGVIYNAGEANSVSLVEIIKREGSRRGIAIVEGVAARSADVQTAARSLVNKVDAIYVPTDNTAVSAIEAIVAVGAAQGIPVFAGDSASVERGAIATIGFSYYQLGLQTGDLIAQILNGENPGNIDARIGAGTDIAVNKAAADAMGVDLPQSVLSSAKHVFN